MSPSSPRPVWRSHVSRSRHCDRESAMDRFEFVATGPKSAENIVSRHKHNDGPRQRTMPDLRRRDLDHQLVSIVARLRVTDAVWIVFPGAIVQTGRRSDRLDADGVVATSVVSV